MYGHVNAAEAGERDNRNRDDGKGESCNYGLRLHPNADDHRRPKTKRSERMAGRKRAVSQAVAERTFVTHGPQALENALENVGQTHRTEVAKRGKKPETRYIKIAGRIEILHRAIPASIIKPKRNHKRDN